MYRQTQLDEPYALFPGTYRVENAKSSSEVSIHAQLSYGQWSGSPKNWFSQSPIIKPVGSPASPARRSSKSPRTRESSTDSHRERRRTSSIDARIVKVDRKSKSPHGTCNSKRTADKNVPTTVPTWPRSILVRIKHSTIQPKQDLRYTLVRLPSCDVSSCIAAICSKMKLTYTIGMSISWVDSKTMLRGPFDQDFIQNIPDMQDFVIDILETDFSGCSELLLEM